MKIAEYVKTGQLKDEDLLTFLNGYRMAQFNSAEKPSWKKYRKARMFDIYVHDLIKSPVYKAVSQLEPADIYRADRGNIVIVIQKSNDYCARLIHDAEANAITVGLTGVPETVADDHEINEPELNVKL